jgi:uncharacterized protein
MSFFKELKRRNVIRVAITYAIAAVVFLSVAAGVRAQLGPYPERPDVAAGIWFVDKANLISEADGAEITEIVSTLMVDEQIPIIVATISSLAAHNAADYTIERYATALFNEWGIGSERRNYGMLLLVSKGDRKARIELGASWGRSYDSDAISVMERHIIPAFKRGQFSEGILAGVRGLDSMARGLGVPVPKQPWWVVPLFIVGAIAVVMVIVNLFKSGRKGWGWALIVGIGVVLFFMMRALGSSGGGSSGGGGASGSW